MRDFKRRRHKVRNKDWRLGKAKKKQNKNLKFLISFFVFHHLFPSCFSTSVRSEKLANVFGSDQKHFCWKKLLVFDFFDSPSVLSPLQNFWFKHVAKRIEFTKANKKCTQNLRRYHVHYKTILRRVDEMANMKKENSKIWAEEAIIP